MKDMLSKEELKLVDKDRDKLQEDKDAIEEVEHQLFRIDQQELQLPWFFTGLTAQAVSKLTPTARLLSSSILFFLISFPLLT